MVLIIGYSAGSKGGEGGSGCGIRYDSTWADRTAGGGAGNPGGIGGYNSTANYTALSGSSGTGGLMILYSNTLNNLGSILSNGRSGGGIAAAGGGSSGGGSINIFTQNITDLGKKEARGGEGANEGGGAGGNGTITIGNISSGTFAKDE